MKLAKDTADKLREAGTPEDMPEDARKGFELVVEKLAELPDDATKDEVEKAQELTEEEQTYSDALGKYIAEKCADQLLPTDGCELTRRPAVRCAVDPTYVRVGGVGQGVPMKRTPLLAALLLVLGLLAGCGSSDSSTAGDDGGSAGGPPTTPRWRSSAGRSST